MKIHSDGSLPNSNEIFVFGSNLRGYHGAGAAKVAFGSYGAVMGVSEGFQTSNGKSASYAIPTKNKNLKALSLSEIERYVKTFVSFVNSNPDKEFFVTSIGCGYAGYSADQIAPMFFELESCDRCSFPDTFAKIFNQMRKNYHEVRIDI